MVFDSEFQNSASQNSAIECQGHVCHPRSTSSQLHAMLQTATARQASGMCCKEIVCILQDLECGWSLVVTPRQNPGRYILHSRLQNHGKQAPQNNAN